MVTVLILSVAVCAYTGCVSIDEGEYVMGAVSFLVAWFLGCCAMGVV